MMTLSENECFEANVQQKNPEQGLPQLPFPEHTVTRKHIMQSNSN